MGIGHWFLFDWRIVGWCATPHTENLVAQIEEVLQEAGLVCDMAREECGLGAAAYRGQLYRDADDTTVVQLQAVWEGDGRWALHALQFFRSPWSSTSKSLALATALQPLPAQPPTPQALTFINHLAAGGFLPRAWSVIVDAPSAAVESWLRATVFPRKRSRGYGVSLTDAWGVRVGDGDLPYVVTIDKADYWVWDLLASPRWVSLPTGNWWVVPTMAAVTRPEVAPITHIPQPVQSGLALRIAEYHGRTTIDCYTFLPVHCLLDRLVRLFREGDARVLFPVRIEHDDRAAEAWLLALYLRSPRDEVTEHLQKLSGAKHMVAELFLKGLTLKDVIRQLDGTVAESSVRRYFWEFHTDPKYAWLKPFLPAPDPVLSEAGRRAWQR